ncbi:MAG: hypothetical protein KAH01_04800 [Caldisericia bacterium]|nr:hypothetical protein [Caldisericia bacterium]
MTEQREAMIDIANDKRRDRDTKHRTEHKEDVELLRDRFKAYVYLKDKK